MNRRLWVWPLLLLFLLILQTTTGGLFSGEVWFDLPLIFVYNLAMLEGVSKGVAAGFCVGLIQDVLTGGSVFGFHLLTRTLIGWGSGTFRELVYRNNYPYHMLAVFLLSLAIRILFLLPTYFLSSGWDGLFPAYATTSLLFAVTNGILSLPCGLFMLRLHRWVKEEDLPY